jgi:LacI family transcriptional regulator
MNTDADAPPRWAQAYRFPAPSQEPSRMLPLRRVLLIVETSKVYGRGLLDGIGRYAMRHGQWSLYVEERGLTDEHPNWLRSWRGDGIIFRSATRRMVEAIRRTGVPAVDTHTNIVDHGFPLVYVDDDRVAELAVSHFLERKFRHFGFCAIEEPRWVEWRRAAYLRHLARLGLTAHTISAPEPGRGVNWDRQRRRLAEWVAALPKPIAVLAANDVCGTRLIDACRTAQIRIPEQVAVLGVDNDEVLCRLTSPPLSSIDLDSSTIGYQAAQLLDDLMNGRPRPAATQWMLPRAVVGRQSTDAMAIEDEDLALALSFIRQYACQGIGVDDVLEHVTISRATLERKFAAGLGRTPGREILRVRLERIRHLLDETTYPLERIAALTGFKNPAHLSVVFKRETGQTPSEFRAQTRSAAGGE